MNSIQSFNKLLEQYVFKVATDFIDLADQETQGEIIKLFNDIDTTASPTDHIVSFTNENSAGLSVNVNKELPSESCLISLEKQWQEVLNKPATQKRTYTDERLKNIERLIRTHQTAIDFTITYIHRLETLLSRAEKCTSSSTKLIARYQSIKNGYESYLDKVQGLQQKAFNKLEEY